jgi:hypothetical protein
MKFYNNVSEFVHKELYARTIKDANKKSFYLGSFKGFLNVIKIGDTDGIYGHIGYQSKHHLLGNLFCIDNIVYRLMFYNMETLANDFDSISIINSPGFIYLDPV